MEWWTKTRDVNYLEYGIDILIQSTSKSTLKRGRHQKEAPTRKPLVINLGKAKLHFKVNVVHQNETSKAADGQVIKEAQALDDSINKSDQDHHQKHSS